MTYTDFQETYLAEHDGNEEHEDAVEWRYWQEVYHRTSSLLAAYQQVQIEVKNDEE